MDREHTCCFAGHRPEKLPWGSDEMDKGCIALQKRMWSAVETAYEAGYRHFICGMARGCDFYFAEMILTLRRERPGVTLEAAIPCRDQASRWAARDRDRWQKLVEACDRKTVLQERYVRGCMQQRNRYMVDHSSLVIAAFDGSPGGTLATLEYAIRQRVPFVDVQLT